MKIVLNSISKRYNRDWIFRNVDYTFLCNQTYAITGPNGSGKSTLLQIVSGAILASKGSIQYFDIDKKIDDDKVHRALSYVAPYLEIPEDFTLKEILSFHFKFKPLINGLKLSELPEKMLLAKSINKQVKYFSTGMKQRLKLGLAFYSDCPILLLDEPATNLDDQGVNWYRNEAIEHAKNRILIVCSNRIEEFDFCENRISIIDYK